jgi:Tol biopolymer transport system component
VDIGSPQGAPAAGDDPPKLVGSFEIIEEIGRGGMGIVYRARDLKLERDVALKRPRPEHLQRPDFRRRFMSEAQTASKLLHPNITTVFEVFEHEGVPWLVMELIEGANLRSLLSGRNPLSTENVLRHAEGLTDALRVAHLGGVLHRDINPNNILIGKDGRSRLNDFGLARAWIEPGSDSGATSATTETYSAESVGGTRGYMSPEQALGKRLDPRSDLFSLGAVLYEMCTGHPAFARGDPGEWMDALLHREPQSISSVNREIPPEFEHIVRKAVAKRPFQRYESASEMLMDIRAVRRKLQSDTDYSWPRSKVRPGSRWIRFAAPASIGVVLAAVVTWAVLHCGAPIQPSMQWTSRQITSAPGWEGEPALSPDGRWIAYASNELGDPDIWLINGDGGNPLRLTNHAAVDSDPAWMPDNSAILFVSDRSGTRSIWKVPPLGGSQVLLLEDALDPAVSPDGKMLAFVRADPSGSQRIAVAPIEDPTRSRFLTGDNDGLWSHRNPSWSPDGSTLSYNDFRNLWLVALDGGPAKPLTTKHAIDHDPAWFPNGRWIYFSSMLDGAYALWRIHVTGDSLERITPGTGPERHPSIAVDGRRVAYSTEAFGRDIIVLDRASRSRYRFPSSRYESVPNMAPDGTAVTFVSNIAGKFDLWIQRLDHGQPVDLPIRLTDHPGSVSMPSYSPDGRWIAYFRVTGDQRDIWMVPSAGGAPTQITQHPAADFQPSFSPDGRYLAFASNRGGHEQIWICEIDGGRPIGESLRLETAPREINSPVWSPDGNSIAFTSEGEVWVTPLEGAAPPRRLTTGADADLVRWHCGANGLLASGSWGGDRVELRFVSLADGSSTPTDPEVVFGDANAHGLFGVSRDGRYVAFAETQSSGDIWIMEAQ